MGMPATLGVWWKGGRRSSKPGAVQAMQGSRQEQEPAPFHGRVLRSAWAWVPLQPRFSIRQPRSGAFGAGLELVELVAAAAVVQKLVGVEARAAEGVELGGAELPDGEASRVSVTQSGWVGQPR